MVSQVLLEKIRLRNSKKDGTLKRLKRPPAWLFPHASDRQYRAALYEYTFTIRKVISEVLLPKIPSMLVAATLPYPDPVDPKYTLDSVVKNDNFIDF